MNVFLWHVHGSWTTAFVQGRHNYFIPVTPERGPDGRGRAQTWDWPENVYEVTRDQARHLPLDVVIVQRPAEWRCLVREWLGGREPGRDVATVYLEHNTPSGPLCGNEHPVANRSDVLLVHVTHFNALFWDSGTTAARVVEHGVVDPGHRYTGELPRVAAVINDAARRGRATGTDLLPSFAEAGPLDVFGFGASGIGGIEHLRQDELHDELGSRRVYLHPYRWTSLGLALVEAMHLGLPVVAVSATEAPDAIPPACGFVSSNVEALVAATRDLLHDPAWARAMGDNARRYALGRFGLDRFLTDWNGILEEVTT
jgi:Glycosyl transferases group 1